MQNNSIIKIDEETIEKIIVMFNDKLYNTLLSVGFIFLFCFSIIWCLCIDKTKYVYKAENRPYDSRV